MTEAKICHRSISLDEDYDSDDEKLILVGAPCIKEKCMAWQVNEMMTGGGFCKDLPQR
jgi:hypothetical protein